MSKVLIVKAHPLATGASRSLKILERFVTTYQTAHPEDEIQWLDVYQDDMPEIDRPLMTAWQQLRSGADFSTLSDEQKAKIAHFDALTQLYIDTDKFVIANPLWNLSVPTRLKAWIDTVMVAGKTFKYTANGPQPLVHGKTAVHIQSAGGVYSGNDFATQYVNSVLHFAGVEEVTKIGIEGIDHMPETEAAVMQSAYEEAGKIARKF
jgi:FMN-dependent NADH-azoreductase